MYICVLLKIDVFPDPFLYQFKFGIYIIYIYFIVLNKDIMHCQIISILPCVSPAKTFFKVLSSPGGIFCWNARY